ncbi:MAG: adenylate kinase [Clostridiales bacterium]|nr:adenylate kinase [Clostridiales bacterium]
MKLILLGAPGAGKGTQAQILSQRLSLPTISTGDLLRDVVKSGTPVGCKVKAVIDAGNLVPDDLVMSIIRERLREPDCKNGYILDGMPRTLTQAEALDKAGIEIDTALIIEISDEEIGARMTGRRVCTACGATYHIVSAPPHKEGICDSCGGRLTVRKDDEPETVKQRLRIFHEETEPLKAYYLSLGQLIKVDNQPTIEATTAAIFKELGIKDDKT